MSTQFGSSNNFVATSDMLAWILGLFCAMALVARIRQRARLDVPNDRSMHANPTPRGGGLGIFLAFVLSGGVLLVASDDPFRVWVPLLAGAVPIALVGWLDDRKGLSPKLRAPIHLLSCLLAVFLYVRHSGDGFDAGRDMGLLWIGG